MQDHKSPNAMKILYVHGFGSNYHPTKPKVQLLRILGEVVGVDVDYCKGFDAAFQKVKVAAMTCDLIVGTSMGGFMASHIGAVLSIPFVALKRLAFNLIHILPRIRSSNIVFNSFAQSLLVRACSKGERKHFTPVMALQIHWNEPLIIEYTSFLEQI